jgi:hypothetical protein
MSLATEYLAARGITEDTAKLYHLELDDRVSLKIVKTRLGRGLPQGVVEVLWFPIYDSAGNLICWIARPLPTLADLGKFLCPVGSAGIPFIPQNVYSLDYGKPVIVTEGPVKTLACVQSGVEAIGLNGVWCAGVKNAGGVTVIRADLQNALDWRGRRVYLGFDADCAINPQVRQALFRLFFLLSVSGAQVFQLSWHLTEGKGIDDYLVRQPKPDESLKSLLAAARPFVEILEPTTLDLAFVYTELEKVLIPPLLREQLCKQLAKPLGVRAATLEEKSFFAQEKARIEPTFTADYEPWPEPVDAEQLLNDVMIRINKEAIIQNHQTLVAGLEVMLTWVHARMEFSPIFYVTAPDRECGKSSLLEVMAKMVRRPVKTSNVSSAAIFRLSELYHPTFLMDEAQDQLKNEDFCLVIKSGHTPGDVAIRCDPNTNNPVIFDVFCPKLLAGIGRANGQIMSRSIIIEMERRDGETDRSIKIGDPELVDLRRKLARWAQDCGDLSGIHFPKQTGIKLRNRDNWQVFYRVASAVSSTVARQLLETIPLFIDEEQDFATYLLASLRKLYHEQDQLRSAGFMGSEVIVEELNQDKEAPWYARDGKGLTVHGLSARLRRYKIKPDKVWQSDTERQVRGFRYVDSRPHHKDLKRVFDQYLPAEETK